jgi:hypothetical protein
MWLNTCIGGRNYGYFFKTVWSLFLFTSSHLASVIVYLVLYFLDVACVKDLTTDWMGLGDGSDNDNTTLSKTIIIINIAFTILLLMVVSMIFQLLSFHLKLRKLKLTTYQFILQDSEQKRKDAKLDIVIEERRSDEIVRLSRMGRNWGVCSLKMYRMEICRGLDPIMKVVLKEQREEEERLVVMVVIGSDDGDGGGARSCGSSVDDSGGVVGGVGGGSNGGVVGGGSGGGSSVGLVCNIHIHIHIRIGLHRLWRLLRQQPWRQLVHLPRLSRLQHLQHPQHPQRLHHLQPLP